jgi:guanylate kinase
VGKGTILARVLEAYPQVWLSVSVTTRQPRPGEIDGTHYYFLSDVQFDDLLARNGLLEWATYGLARYGTPRRPVETKMAQGRAVVMELDLAGARQVRECLPGARFVFIAPPSWDDLEARLRSRATESEEAIQRRLAAARVELDAMDEFDQVIVNTEVAQATTELVNFLSLDSVLGCTKEKD